MPTPLPRIQVCAEPDLYARVKTLAKGRNLSLSHTVSELLELAFKQPTIKEELAKAAAMYGEVPVMEDKRTKPRQRPHFKAYETLAEQLIQEREAKQSPSQEVAASTQTTEQQKLNNFMQSEERARLLELIANKGRVKTEA